MNMIVQLNGDDAMNTIDRDHGHSSFFMMIWSAVIHRDLYSCTFVSMAVNFAFIRVIFHCVVRSHGNRTTA